MTSLRLSSSPPSRLLLHRSGPPRALHSFPTRRSSDLDDPGLLARAAQRLLPGVAQLAGARVRRAQARQLALERVEPLARRLLLAPRLGQLLAQQVGGAPEVALGAGGPGDHRARRVQLLLERLHRRFVAPQGFPDARVLVFQAAD